MTTDEVTAIARAAAAAVAPFVADGNPPGLVGLVGIGDESEAFAVGRTALDEDRTVRRDTIFRIASMTKPIVAAAAMMLIEEGKLALDEPVDRLLPELASRRVLRSLTSALDDTVSAERPITVEDLLTFRLGLGAVFGSPDDYPILKAIADRDLVGFGPPNPGVPYGPDEYMRRLSKLPLMAQPGERWLYTAGSNILGVLIARADRRPLPELLRARIFAPLGMEDTGFFAPPGKADRLPAAYWTTPEDLKLFDRPPDSRFAAPPAFPAGDSGLVSTVADLFAFSRLLLGLGAVDGRRLLSEGSIAAMTRNHLSEAQRAEGAAILGPDHGWGFGLATAVRTTPDGAPAGSFGWNGGLGTSWVMDPRAGKTAILLTQAAFSSPDPPPVHKAFWRAVFA